MRSTALRRSQTVVLAALGLVATIVVGACMGPVMANPAASRGPGPPTPTPQAAPSDPQPIAFPADDGPHDRLTEWWYYTGHLRDAVGARYGFEFVIFRAERGTFPVTWASHLAITDEAGGSFHYAQRSEVGPQVDVAPTLSSGPTSFALAISGLEPGASPDGRTPWVMRGHDGQDRLTAELDPEEAVAAGAPGGLALDLRLDASKPVVLHDEDGWIDFGPAGGSYYYSRTALDADGSIVVDGRALEVTGTGWFDHQWGDFISIGGGWDWFALNLDDGTDLMLSLVRSPDGAYPLVYGTLVDPAGSARRLDRTDFTVSPSGTWRSLRTGATYPASWAIEIPGERLRIELAPTVADQELDTRATTGVVYWEGSQTVTAKRGGVPVGGEAYVELTGYGP